MRLAPLALLAAMRVASAQSGSGSGSGPRVIQLPTDLNAPQVTAAASPTVVRLGAKFTLFVEATFAGGVVVNLQEPIELGGSFEVVRKLSADTPAADGRTTREWQIEVIAWDLGEVSLPPITVTYTAFGKADQVATNRVKLRVEGVLGDVVDDPKALRGNADPTELLARDWFWLYVAIGATLSIGAIIAIAVTWRRRRMVVVIGVGGDVVVPRAFDSAGERALARLLAIERSGVLDRDDDRKHGYTEMVETIRDYVASRYRVVTADLTSSELLRRLVAIAPAAECGLIETWLEACDIVKYGGLKATAARARQTLDDARGLVVATTRANEPTKRDDKEAA